MRIVVEDRRSPADCLGSEAGAGPVGGRRVKRNAPYDGIDAFERIRADAATVPVVAFTASVTPGDRKSIGDAGFDGFLSKPINLKEFVETVRRLAGEPTP